MQLANKNFPPFTRNKGYYWWQHNSIQWPVIKYVACAVWYFICCLHAIGKNILLFGHWPISFACELDGACAPFIGIIYLVIRTITPDRRKIITELNKFLFYLYFFWWKDSGNCACQWKHNMHFLYKKWRQISKILSCTSRLWTMFYFNQFTFFYSYSYLLELN